MSAIAFIEVLSALNTLLAFARDNGVSSRVLLTEYLAARVEGRHFTEADVVQIKAQARAAIDKLKQPAAPP